jgi:hypothetical protein
MGQAKRAYKLAFRLQGRSVTTAEPQGIFTGGYALLISYGECVISLPDSKATDNTRKSLSDKLDSGFCYSVIILLKDLVYIYIQRGPPILAVRASLGIRLGFREKR